MKSKLHIFLFTILFLGLSCGDDDDNDVNIIPEADRTEQQVIDNDSLVGYLQTHYINSSYLINNQNISLDEVIINSIPDDGILPDPDVNTLLIALVETLTTTYSETDYVY